MPKISVVIPSYNHASYVCQTIESVFTQDIGIEALEVIVIDDCSADNTIEKLTVFNQKYPFRLIINSKNLGLNASLELGIKNCSGDYLCILGSDDCIASNKISKQLQYIQANNLDCVYSRGYYIDAEGKITGEQDLSEFSAEFNKGNGYAFIAVDDTNGPLLQSGMFRLDVANKITHIRNKFKSDDWAVLLTMLKEYRFGFINEPLFYYRIHPQNSHTKYWQTLPMRLEIPCILLANDEKKLRMKSISNIFFSHSAALIRDKKYLSGIKFLLASFIFGFPARKIMRKIWK